MSTNPLLENYEYPPFNRLNLGHLEQAFDSQMNDNLALLDRLEKLEQPGWDDFVAPIDEADARLQAIWSLVSAYNAVLNSDEVRELHVRLLERLTRYRTDFSQNKGLFQGFENFAKSAAFDACDEAQKASVRHILRDFKLGGIDLSPERKKLFAEQSQTLSKLKNTFAQNLLDATQGWQHLVSDEQALEGVPESARKLMSENAEKKGHASGFLMTLDMPCFQPVMTYCKNRELRRQLYDAYMTRASDQGDGNSEWDNSAVMEDILSCRKAMAELLGFDNYAEYSLASKMATSVSEVIEFLELLAEKSMAQARAEMNDLERFAQGMDGIDYLEMWDLAYYSEKLKQERYGFSKEEVRNYFPLPKVLDGLFELASILFDVEICVRPDIQTYHPSVSFHEIRRDGKPIAGFYMDLYARENKRAGAWLANCKSRLVRQDSSVQNPLAFLVCNFTAPSSDGTPSLLLPEELRTLFHEFGHCLHYTLTSVGVANVAGISNVPWDAVELPSQLLENWCWQEEVVAMTSGHIDSGEVLPGELLKQVRESQRFQSGMMMVRQLEFALFDFILHRDFEPGQTNVNAVLDRVRDRVSVKKQPGYTRFANGFSHIFAGGYAAGYYSYKWAEVLAADAFSRFIEEGVMSAQVGESFRAEILELGGSRDVNDMFRAFRGREPQVEPLLKQSGIMT